VNASEVEFVPLRIVVSCALLKLQRAVLDQFAGDMASGPVEQPLEAVLEINRGGKIERR
jgi:hypothetical protein